MLVATYNIHFGMGRDGGLNLDRIADAIAAADILAVQEVTAGVPFFGRQDQIGWLAQRLDRHVVFGTGIDVDASYTAPGGRPVRCRAVFGNAIYSRWPIEQTRTQLLPKGPMPDQIDLQRSVTEAVIAHPDHPFRFYNVHLSDVGPAQRAAQIPAVRDFVVRAPQEGRAWEHTGLLSMAMGKAAIVMPTPMIVAGDFNLRASETANYRALCGAAGGERWQDAWLLAGRSAAEGATWGDDVGDPRRIDYVFVGDDFAPAVRRAWIDSMAGGSDHLPLFIEFAMN